MLSVAKSQGTPALKISCRPEEDACDGRQGAQIAPKTAILDSSGLRNCTLLDHPLTQTVPSRASALQTVSVGIDVKLTGISKDLNYVMEVIKQVS